MNTAKYPNRDALRDANDIYLDTMRPFIIRQLKQVRGEKIEDLISRILKPKQRDEFQRVLNETDDIESAIDFSYFPHIIEKHWSAAFVQRFDEDLKFQSMLWLIREGRNSCEHRGTKDLNSEFVRVNLFLISEVLAKINTDKQREVEAIRDELFFDDTPERLSETEERLEAAEGENTEYKKSLSEAKERLEVTESKNREYKKENIELSNRAKKLDKRIKDANKAIDTQKKKVAGAKQRAKKSEAAQAENKKRLRTTSKELKDTKNELISVQAEKSASEARLAFTQNLLITAAIGDQSIFPALDTNSRVRILDRRGTEKKDYLSKLLEQKQPIIIYVQSEKMADLLLTDILPEKESVIEKHSIQTSDAEEKELLGRLVNGELIAVVSNTVFSRLAPSHCVEHFVFCHISPDLDTFFGRCQPIFTSEKNTHLHLIYNHKKDLEILNQWLTDKYPDREMLNSLYGVLRECIEINGDFIKPENIYSQLDMVGLGITEMGIETGLSIFEEVGALERNRDSIKLLPFSGRKSKIHQKGVELKDGIVEVCAFQLEQPIEKIWEEIQEKLDVDSEQILREDSLDEVYPSVSEIQSDQQRTETVENDSGSDAEDSEANQVPKPERANAKVTEEQLREIQSRSAAGESNSELAKEFNLSPPAIRFVAETAEGTRNEIAVKVVELRINKEGSRPIAWKKIREKLGLHNDHFHQVIRHSEGYFNAVLERIKSLKSADGGWEYNGKLSVLTGIEDIENYLE